MFFSLRDGVAVAPNQPLLPPEELLRRDDAAIEPPADEPPNQLLLPPPLVFRVIRDDLAPPALAPAAAAVAVVVAAPNHPEPLTPDLPCQEPGRCLTLPNIPPPSPPLAPSVSDLLYSLLGPPVHE